MRLLAIDPGKFSGWAVFEKGRLVACGLVEHKRRKQTVTVDQGVAYAQAAAAALSAFKDKLPASVDCVTIELPRVWGAQTESPNAVLKCAVSAGAWLGFALATWGVEAKPVTPGEWKASTNKDIQNARDWGALAPAEREVVAAWGRGVAPSKRNHTLDAIGIGLHYLGRGR